MRFRVTSSRIPPIGDISPTWLVEMIEPAGYTVGTGIVALGLRSRDDAQRLANLLPAIWPIGWTSLQWATPTRDETPTVLEISAAIHRAALGDWAPIEDMANPT